jgi:hypothetical protein
MPRPVPCAGGPETRCQAPYDAAESEKGPARGPDRAPKTIVGERQTSHVGGGGKNAARLALQKSVCPAQERPKPMTLSNSVDRDSRTRCLDLGLRDDLGNHFVFDRILLALGCLSLLRDLLYRSPQRLRDAPRGEICTPSGWRRTSPRPTAVKPASSPSRIPRRRASKPPPQAAPEDAPYNCPDLLPARPRGTTWPGVWWWAATDSNPEPTRWCGRV